MIRKGCHVLYCASPPWSLSVVQSDDVPWNSFRPLCLGSNCLVFWECIQEIYLLFHWSDKQAGRQAGRLTDNRRNYVHKDITLHCKLRSSSPTDTVQPWICRRIQWGAAVHIAAVIGPSACTALSAVAAAVVVVDVHRCTRSEDTWRTPSRNGRH